MTKPKEPLPYRIAGYLGRVAASYTIFGAYVLVVHFTLGKSGYLPHELYSFKAWMTSFAFTAIIWVIAEPLIRHWEKP